MIGGLKPEDPGLIGPYRLVGRLGSGGMGQVFLGLSAGGRLVAVKVIRAELAADEEFRVRFSREVAAARRVSGLFTALVVDADVDGPVPWLATAYVAGPSLAQAVTGSGPMPVRPVLALAAGLAESLNAIHTAGVVHCDLKPSNVLLSQDGPRVIDFGVSRAAGASSVAGAGWVVGSPGFMSPEQAMGKDVGPPSDIFSLGAVLTFAATSQGPFGQGSRPELAYRLVYGPPDLDPVPSDLRPLVERCLAKDPAQRPTAGEVLATAAPPTADWLPDAPPNVLPLVPLPREPSDWSALSLPPAPSVPRESSVPRAPSVPPELSFWPESLGSPDASGPPPSAGRRRRRTLTAAALTAGALAAGVAVPLVLSSAAQHQSLAPLAPKVAAAPASSSASAVHRTRPAPARSSAAPGPASPPTIFPVIYTVTSPGTPTSHPPSPTAHPSRSPSPSSPSPTASSRSPSPSPSSPSPTASSPAPSPSPSTPRPAAPPQIANV